MLKYLKPVKLLPGISITTIGLISGYLTINLYLENKIKDPNIGLLYIRSCWICVILFLIAVLYIVGYVQKYNSTKRKFEILEVTDDKTVILKKQDDIAIYEFVKFIQINSFKDTTIGYGYCYDIEKYTYITPLMSTKGNEETYNKLLKNDANTKGSIQVQKKITKDDYCLLEKIFTPSQGGI